MPWIRNNVQDGSSCFNKGILENRTLVNNHHLLPMAVMRRCLDIMGLSRHSPAGLVSSSGRGRLQPLAWKTSFTENLDRGTKRGTLSKRKISKEELKNSISVPYGPLHLVEVGPIEGEEDVEGSDHKRPRMLRPPAYRASAIRPQKIKPGNNSYTPVESTLAQPVSKRELVARVYRNTVLACKDIHRFKQLEASASQTLARLDHRIKELHHLESAVLAVYLLRHRVMVFEGSKPFQCRANAFAAYGAYTAGKFCYPDGDLLILPGFHSDLAVSRSVLSELQVAMHTIHNLGGPYSPRVVKIKDPKTITSAVRKLNRVGKEFPVEGVDPIDLFFKPVFTNFHYHMNNDKARLTVEVLQATIIVLINLTEEALWNEDFGAALFLAQNIRRCANCLLWILSDDDLKNSYLFTMMEWYWARSYFNVSSHWSQHRDHMITRYNTTKKELEGFSNSCYGGIVLYAFLVHVDCSTSNPRQEFCFPQTACESTRLSVEGYNKIEVPPSWLRSTYERVSSVALNLHFKIMAWADSVDRRVKGESFAHNIVEIHESNTEIDNVLQQQFEEGLPCLRVLLYNLSAKCCRILAADDDATALRSRIGRPCLVGWKAYSETYLDKRSLRQWAALKLMIKVYRANPSDHRRRMLLKIGRQTFFDEVIYEVQKQVTDPTRTGGLSTITRLLPYVLYVWFGADVPTQPGGLEDKIPKEEKPIFDQIIAMMFMGSALIHCLMFRSAVDEPEKSRLLNNAIYFHVLAWPYLQRFSVMSAVVNSFYKSLELAEASNIQYHKKSLQNGASRCCAILLGYVVTLLPMLWEMCIGHKDDCGPNEGERNVVIGEIKYPVDVKTKSFGTTTDKVDLKIYESITTFLNFDFGLTSSREGRCVVLRGDSGSEKEPSNVSFMASCHYSLNHEQLHDVTVSRPVDVLPLLTGTCGCSGRKKGCPIENYHYVDEQRFVVEDEFDNELYDEVFSNLSLTNGNAGDDSLDHLFLNLKKTIENVLAKTISELQVLKDKKVAEIKIETNGNSPVSALRLDRLLNDLAHTSRYLKFPDPPVLVVTRVLSSLDQIFHDKQTHAMLRGSF